MRKVLLATTALVAMGGVSAASADISISMSSEFKYTNYSDNAGTSTDKSTYASTTDAVITATSALDNGMSVKATIDVDEGANNAGGMSISGDFGTLGFKDLGSEHGTMSGAVTADEGTGLAATWNGGTAAASEITMPASDGVPKSTVSWTSPDISGFGISLGLTEGGTGDDGNQMGVNYTLDAGGMTIKLNYASHELGTAKSSQTAASVTAGDFVVTMASNETKTTAGASDRSGDVIGVTYKMSDTLSVQGYSGTTDDDTDADYKITDTGIGATYTITPGLTASITHNDYSATTDGGVKTEGDFTALAINVSF